KGLMPKSQVDCLKSWEKIMPDYKIMRWDEHTFNYYQYSASLAAYKTKKYAFLSDVCRFNVLYEYGGIYLDTDVEVFKRFDNYLNSEFFSAIELYREFYSEGKKLVSEVGEPLYPGIDVPHLEILTSTMGCQPGNNFIGELRDFYNSIDADDEYALN